MILVYIYSGALNVMKGQASPMESQGCIWKYRTTDISPDV